MFPSVCLPLLSTLDPSLPHLLSCLSCSSSFCISTVALFSYLISASCAALGTLLASLWSLISLSLSRPKEMAVADALSQKSAEWKVYLIKNIAAPSKQLFKTMSSHYWSTVVLNISWSASKNSHISFFPNLSETPFSLQPLPYNILLVILILILSPPTPLYYFLLLLHSLPLLPHLPHLLCLISIFLFIFSCFTYSLSYPPFLAAALHQENSYPVLSWPRRR